MQHKKSTLSNNITRHVFSIYINEIVTQKKENCTARIGIIKDMQYIELVLSSDSVNSDRFWAMAW
jgi:hypothetical protein